MTDQKLHSHQDPSFKNIQKCLMRALSRNTNLEGIFTKPRTTNLDQNIIYLNISSIEEGEEGTTRIRGIVDSAALKKRFHTPKIYAQYLPRAPEAQEIYYMLEKLRFETLGAKKYPGVARNLTYIFRQYLQERLQESPKNLLLSNALTVMAHERLTGNSYDGCPPDLTQMCKKLQRKIGTDLESLVDQLHHQKNFNYISRKIINKLGMNKNPKSTFQDGESSKPPPEVAPKTDPTTRERVKKASLHQLPDATPHTEQHPKDSNKIDPSNIITPDNSKSSSLTARPKLQGANAASYSIYTTVHDQIIHAHDLGQHDELYRLRHTLDQELTKYQNNITQLANKLQRHLLTQQKRSWDFDQDEGIIDAARLSRVITSPNAPLSFKVEKESEFQDTLITLLIDNSGSMRGTPIKMATLCADILTQTLERCNVKVEILGFTTQHWKGGKSYEQWVRDGQPPNPGRLNDLQHIIYKPANKPWRRCRNNLGLMLKEGILKENIDGEAILWAYQRLLRYTEKRRILIVISDGAPVDSSTLSANSALFLDHHLRKTIAFIENFTTIQLVAIGIGHDVTDYYKNSVKINDINDLGATITNKLIQLFSK